MGQVRHVGSLPWGVEQSELQTTEWRAPFQQERTVARVTDTLERGLLFCWASGEATEDPQVEDCVTALDWEGPSRSEHGPRLHLSPTGSRFPDVEPRCVRCVGLGQ